MSLPKRKARGKKPSVAIQIQHIAQQSDKWFHYKHYSAFDRVLAIDEANRIKNKPITLGMFIAIVSKVRVVEGNDILNL